MDRLPQNVDYLQSVIDNSPQSSLGKLVEKARWLLTLDRSLKTLLPTGFQAFCHVMNVNEHQLILGVTNAAIATRIRLMSPELIAKLKRNPDYYIIENIVCKVCAETVEYSG